MAPPWKPTILNPVFGSRVRTGAPAADLLPEKVYEPTATFFTFRRVTASTTKAHISLLRAAAAHRLYLLSAETDQSLLGKARRYAAEFRAAGHPVAPPRSLFGPRFLEFLASGG